MTIEFRLEMSTNRGGTWEWAEDSSKFWTLRRLAESLAMEAESHCRVWNMKLGTLLVGFGPTGVEFRYPAVDWPTCQVVATVPAGALRLV